MWSSETLATLVSMISIRVGSITVTATIHLLSPIAPTALPKRFPPFMSLREEHRGDDGHPDPQDMAGVFSLREDDLDRDPLDDLDVVPRRVLRREEGEGGAGPRHDAVHRPAERLSGIGVHVDL